MTIKIHLIEKDGLDLVDTKEITLANTTSMTISHYAYSVKSTSASIPFSIEGAEKHIPHVDEIEFCTVVRKKVDFTAVGPNEKVIKEIGKDVGKYDYKDDVPTKPTDLPPGFTEIYKG